MASWGLYRGLLGHDAATSYTLVSTSPVRALAMSTAGQLRHGLCGQVGLFSEDVKRPSFF